MKLRFNGKDHTANFKSIDTKHGRFECICACTGVMFFIPLVSIPESRFGRYWANQGLLILIIELLCLIIGLILGGILSLLSLIPYVGIVFNIIKKIIAAVLCLVAAFYIIYPMTFAARGKATDIPFLGFIRAIR